MHLTPSNFVATVVDMTIVNLVNDDTVMTDEHLTLVLARFDVMERLREPDHKRVISDSLAELYYAAPHASPQTVRKLIERGWLKRPAAGQVILTTVGRARIHSAINTRAIGSAR